MTLISEMRASPSDHSSVKKLEAHVVLISNVLKGVTTIQYQVKELNVHY